MSPRRWTLTVCPECGLQAPLGYECSGGGDKDHSLNVPVERVEVMPVGEHEEVLRAFRACDQHPDRKAIAASAACGECYRLWMQEAYLPVTEGMVERAGAVISGWAVDPSKGGPRDMLRAALEAALGQETGE